MKRDQLTEPVTRNLNTFNYIIDKQGLLDDLPVTRLEIPPGALLIANGSTLAHQVVYGRRMVSLEASVKMRDADNPIGSEQEDFEKALGAAGLKTTADTAIPDALRQADGSTERAKKRLAHFPLATNGTTQGSVRRIGRSRFALPA